MAAAEKKYRIGISTHAFDAIDFDIHFNHQACVASWSRNYDLVFIGKKGLDAARARCMMADMAIKAECTHMLFMDADHFFPLEALPLLLENGDEAMVSGLVCKKGEGFPQVAWMTSGSGATRKYALCTLPLDGGVYEVGICAFGCTLINMDKMQKLDKPIFRDTCDDTAGGIPDNIRSDVNICNAFREQLKEKVFVDTRVLIGHFPIEIAIYPQNAELIRHLMSVIQESQQLKAGQVGHWLGRE